MDGMVAVDAKGDQGVSFDSGIFEPSTPWVGLMTRLSRPGRARVGVFTFLVAVPFSRLRAVGSESTSQASVGGSITPPAMTRPM